MTRKIQKQQINKYDDVIPTKFMCSLAKQIMTDPVIAFDGNTYECKEIEKYFNDNDKSPITDDEAYDVSLCKGRALKKEICNNHNTIID